MKIALILLVIIIGVCLANTTLTLEPFNRGSDYNPKQYMSSECPCLSCIDQPCMSPYKT